MKNEWTIILCFSISLSLISGLNYFFNASQKYEFANSFWLFSDIDLVHQDLYYDNGSIIPHIRFNEYFQKSDHDVRKTLETTNLDLESYAPYAIFGLDMAFVTINAFSSVFTANCTSENDYYQKLNATRVRFGIFDSIFYSSQRFKSYFHIIEGRTPKNNSEILVDYNFAQKYNYHINKTSNVTIAIGNVFDSNPPVSDLLNEKIENITIVGTYLCEQEWFRIADQRYTYSYTYNDYLLNKTYIQPLELEQNLVFWFGDFNNLTNHPIQKWFNKIDQINHYREYLNNGIIKSGYLLFYNRGNIQFENLNFYRNSIKQKSRNLSIFLPFEISLIDKLSYQLVITQGKIRTSFLTIQILSLPVIVFSLLVSRNINDSRGKKANEELILLKLRGVSVRQIQMQIFLGGVINGVICTLLGSGMGYGTFYMYHRLLGDLFLNTSDIFLSPIFTWNNFWFTLFLGIGINAISLIPKIIAVGRIEYVDVSSAIQQVEELSLQYDEKVLFDGEKRKRYVDEDLIDQYIKAYIKSEKAKSDKNQNETSSNNNNYQKIFEKSDEQSKNDEFSEENKSIDKKERIRKIKDVIKRKKKFPYESLFDMEKYSIKKITLFLLFLGIIPFVLYLFLFLSLRFEASDFVIDMRDRLIENIYYIHFFSLFFIGFFVTGVIRLILIERPSRYAKIAKKIAHLFLKKLDHIVSLEIIRKKKWARVTIYLSIFCAMLTITNFTFNSQYRYEIFNDQFLAGSDFNINFVDSDFTNQTNFRSFEQNLFDFIEQEYSSLIQDYTTIYQSNTSWVTSELLELNQLSNFPINMYSISPSEYLSLISTDDRPYIYPSYPKQIKKIRSESETNNSIIKTIVTSQLLSLSGLEIGDSLDLNVQVFDSIKSEYYNQSYTLEIVQVLDYAPGLYQTDKYGLSALIIDNAALNISNSQWFATNVIELLDFKPDFDISGDQLSRDLRALGSSFYDDIHLQTFDPHWNDIDVARYSLVIGSSGFYGLINLDFVIIGILLSIELSLTIIIMNRENESFTELLLFRGVGRNKILFIIILELLIVFLLSGILGLIIGYFYSWFICFVNLQVLIQTTNSHIIRQALFPIYGNFGTILTSYGIIFMIVLLIVYLVEQQRNKKMEGYLNKKKM
ncbi:MAG: FtsX-like permease family protein [Promethearchaeota archaeon]